MPISTTTPYTEMIDDATPLPPPPSFLRESVYDIVKKDMMVEEASHQVVDGIPINSAPEDADVMKQYIYMGFGALLFFLLIKLR